MENTISVNFGKEGYKAMWNEMKKQLPVSPTKEDMDRAVSAGAFYLIDRLMDAMKEQGYRSIGRGRAIFEDALDWEAKLLVPAIIERRLKAKKVPKVIAFKVSVPKVE